MDFHSDWIYREFKNLDSQFQYFEGNYQTPFVFPLKAIGWQLLIIRPLKIVPLGAGVPLQAICPKY